MELLGLAVDGRTDPLGTATRGLRFSWRFGDPDDGAAQTSASIEVHAGDIAVWSSGRVATGDPWLTMPDDVVLDAWTEYSWRVRVELGDAVLDGAGTFVPAPIDDTEWCGARWIGAPAAVLVPESTDDDRAPSERALDGSLAAPLLSTTIDLGTGIGRVLLALTAGGHADVLVDGALATDEVLAPSTVHWHRRTQVVLHDLTSVLGDGAAHELAFEVGRGFHGMTNANVWGWERAPWHAEPSVRAVLRVERADGGVEAIPTGPDWTARRGTRLLDDLYGGELVDLRRRPGGPLADPGAPAALVAGPTGASEPRREQPIRVVETLAADAVTEPVPGVRVFAFPRVIAGWVRLRLPGGAAGTTVTVRYGERLRVDGLPNADDEKHYFEDGFQTDRIVLDDVGADWEPRFSYKGFRFVSVEGWAGDGPTVDDVTACVVRSDVAVAAELALDDPLLQWMHDATVRTMENNLHGYPTDTPKYEKNGWTGDAMVGADMFLTDLDAAALFRKWIGDLAETTRPGHPPALIAPNADVFGVDAVAPVWHAALVLVPWDLYRHTGDDAVLREHWATIAGYVRTEWERSPGGIADTILGDWVAPGTDPGGGNPPEDSRVPATAFLIRMLDVAAAIARTIGEEPLWFEDRAAEGRRAFAEAFVDVGAGVVRGPGDAGLRQSHQVLALAFDLLGADVPELRQRVADSLAADVAARGDHLDTGAIGTKWLLPVLDDHGHGPLAMRVARQTTAPSWGAWREAGATSTFEHWDLTARSHGHYFLGTVDDWLTGWVAGVRPLAPGWRRFAVAPRHARTVRSARFRHVTPYGELVSAYATDPEGTVDLSISVPVGCEAVVTVPGGGEVVAGPGRHRFAGSV